MSCNSCQKRREAIKRELIKYHERLKHYFGKNTKADAARAAPDKRITGTASSDDDGR